VKSWPMGFLAFCREVLCQRGAREPAELLQGVLGTYSLRGEPLTPDGVDKALDVYCRVAPCKNRHLDEDRYSYRRPDVKLA
jgi:hypothetical protein